MTLLTLPIRDVVFPLLKAKIINNTEMSFEDLIGTGFLIGNRGFALTAAHVIDQLEMNSSETVAAAAFVTSDTSWLGQLVLRGEKHPTEDVGLVEIQNMGRQSIFGVSTTPYHASAEFDAWGYPKAISDDSKKFGADGLHCPDLIYTRGYIRRRISKELPFSIYVGSAFYELSAISAGSAYSGSPVVFRRQRRLEEKWELMGIYIGERSSDEIQVAYAVRAESFADWRPTILGGSSIAEESQT